MTLDQVLPAIKSGKQVRRASWKQGVFFNPKNTITFFDTTANDWEVIYPPIKDLNFSRLALAWDSVSKIHHSKSMLFKDLAKVLGL